MCAVFVLLSTVDALRTGVAFGAALVLAATGLAMLLYVRARDFIRSNRTSGRKMSLLPCIVTLGVAAFFAVVATIHAGAKHSSDAMFPWLPPLDPAPVVGPASPSGGAVAHDLAPGESVGPIVCPTNFTYGGDLAFFGVSPVSTGVWFGVSGAFAAVSPDGLFDLWTCGDLAVPDWRRGVTLDAAGAVSNFVAFVETPPAPAAFYRLAPSAAAVADSDGDGLPDAYERIVCRTDPHCADTDGDGDPDGWELDRRLDPLVDEPGVGMPAVGGTGLAAPSAASPSPAAGPRLLAAGGGVITDGMPQIESDGEGSGDEENHFSESWSLPFTATVTGYYTFTVAADDDATLTIGGRTLSVSWDRDHGADRSLDVWLKAGCNYRLSVSYENSGGGPYFLRTSYSGPGGLPLPYDPGLLVDPTFVSFSLGETNLTDLTSVAKKIGTCDPDKTYEIIGTPGTGVVCADDRAWPDLANPCWHDGMTSRVDFVLRESSSEGVRDVAFGACLFVCTPVKDPERCGCCNEGTTCENGCVSFAQAFGRTPGVDGLPVGRAVVRESCPHVSLGTVAALRYDHPMMRRIVRRHNLNAVVIDGLGTPTEYYRGRPVGVSGGSDGCLFRDADGAFVEILSDGLRVVYNDAGTVVALQPENGARVAVADLGIAVTRNAAGAIIAVDSVADGHLVASATGNSAWRLAWTSPTGAPVKTFDFAWSTDDRVFALHEQRGAAFGFDYRWTYDAALGDWVFEQGVGTPDAIREEKTLVYDAVTRDWTATRTRRGAGGNVLVATSSTLNRNGHAIRETTRRDAATGQLLAARTLDANGRVAQETDERGLVTRRAYDEWNRVTEETSVDIENALTNTVACAYAPADRGAVERRPIVRTTSLNGETLLEECFAYATNALGGAIILRWRATVGGAPRVSYEEYDACARLTLTVREDGRATRIAYGEWGDGGDAGEGGEDGRRGTGDASGDVRRETEDEGVIEGWGEIVAAVVGGEMPSQLSQSLAASFALVPGKSTREIRAVSAQGDVIRRETFAYALGETEPRMLARTTAAYSPTHKPTFTAHSDGTTEAADWICPGPVWQTGRDGVTVSNEYGGAKLLAATTRYGAFGPVTTRYDRDAAGRIIRETTVAPNCETQTVVRTYDSRGRVTGETDAQGRTTTTEYSGDDRVTATTFADGGTRIMIRNADGTLASITGTTVTPEYHTYGVTNLTTNGGGRGATALPMTNVELVGRGVLTAPQPYPNGFPLPVGFGANGNLSTPVRVHEVRYGRADSPRFTRTYTDGFGDVICEERSGANGATLVTENEYDAFGRLVATAETAQPLVAYEYDAWGDRTAREESADDEWRLAETETASVVADDGEVWRETTATRSCSDAAIAPLVTAQRTRLSGLTLATNSLTITTDIRGNENIVRNILNPASQSSHEITLAPGILNAATNWYTDGVMVSNISHSGVQTQIRRDALRRETARIDGRGNVTRTEYDALGRVAATFDALTNATTYAYDAMNRVAAITNALGDATVYEYDHRGNKTYEGGATYPVRYTYDIYGNKTTMTTYRHEPDGGVGHAALPAPDGTTVGRGDLSAPPGDTTTWFYDEASGVMTNKVYADGKGPRYTYTDDGKLATRTWARGIVTTYAYDGWNNLTNTSYSDDTPTVIVAYDAFSRQVEAHDAAGVTTFAYDAYGVNTNETVIGVAGTNVLERFTDAYGRNAGYALNGARQTILGYDEHTGRITTMQVPTTTEGEEQNHCPPPPAPLLSTFHWTYLPNSDLKAQLAYPNGLTASWTYDANNQLLQVRNATPTNVISQYDYTYDAAGRRVACARSGDAMSVADTIAYAYNVRGELTNAVSNVDANYAYAYQYDDIGNRITSEECGVRSAEYVANELNQYTQIDTASSAFSAPPCETFNPEFDDDGNQTLIRTATGTWRVTYNGENRPVLWTCLAASDAIATNGETIAMSYDRMGRRVVKNDQRFVYDGYLQIANFDSITTTPNYNSFIWDPTEPIATRPLAWNNSSFYYTNDGNKNVSEVIVVDGMLAAHYRYSPFGVIAEQFGTSVAINTWRFSSEFADDELKVSYYNYRPYSPITGRWLVRDAVFNESEPSLYAFIKNQYSGWDVLGERYGNSVVDQAGIPIGPSSPYDSFNTAELSLRKMPSLEAEGCECWDEISKAIDLANEWIQRPKCRKWFLEHMDNVDNSAVYKVACHGKSKLPCWLYPAWTTPFNERIGVCTNKLQNNQKEEIANIIIHELAHHYCTMLWGREDCAMSAQDACWGD